ncbi:MAG: STAS/SEC14 domain-containing protein [Methylococcaceae bacterium]
MSYNIIKQTGEINRVKLSGKLTVQDFLELQALATENLAQFGRFLALIELENFQGWSKEPNKWEQTSFLTENEGQLFRMAIVGDEKWKDDVYLFTGKPLRSTDMQFFPQDQLDQAERWLSEKIQ